MNHISEDTLLEYALEIIDNDKELDEIELHLKECAECRKQFEVIHNEINIIGNVRGRGQFLSIPEVNRKHRLAYTLFKAAALIVFGFSLGYGTSNWTHRETISILPTYLKPSPPADSLIGFAASDATHIDEEYHNLILDD